MVDDLNSEREVTGNGFGYMNQIIKDGRRNSMARAFLYPVLKRDNVTVLVNTQVNRVLLQRQDAPSGVECVRNGRKRRPSARDGEVILSTGGFNTPKLLMLSGIGKAADLRALNIPVEVHAPEVGKNVQDHILHGGCLYEAPDAVRVPQQRRQRLGLLQDRRQARAARRQPGADRDPLRERGHRRAVLTTAQHLGAVCRPRRTRRAAARSGCASANPAERPIVDMKFLSHPDDVAALERSIEIARSVAATAAMKPFVVREVAPGRTLTGEELANFVRNGATTYFHSSGACRMGKDDRAVVDAELRVNGVSNLRIADSTIMPRIVAVPTMPACVLIGLRMAELLTESRRAG